MKNTFFPHINILNWNNYFIINYIFKLKGKYETTYISFIRRKRYKRIYLEK